MSTDAWGITRGYYDLAGEWHDTTPETHRALLAAMGVQQDAPGPEPAPLIVVRSGQSAELTSAGALTLEDGTVLRVDGHLPPDVPLGYHEFRPDRAGRTMRVIVSPGICPAPPNAAWGWAAQLYAARSRQSWGLGDLADLRRLAEWSAKLGADCLLLNPLNAVAPVAQQQPSPYSPTSRRFRNPLYLRIEEIPGADALGGELEPLAAAGRALNDNRRLDRDTVFQLKQRACETIWARFSGDPACDRYCAEQGVSLEQFAIYCALAERFGGDWHTWPEEYRRPDGPAVREFTAAHERRVKYHQWLQWLLDEQVARASSAVAIVNDLPIGFDPGGADAWAWQDQLAPGISVGSPPDMYNSAGQDWGLPPLVPHKLRAAGYVPFVETIRATLRHAGGLRIDHVMGLFRLFWIPQGFGARGGAYVRYRADELLAVLALESHRAGAFIVGEDLGTVEAGVREFLAEHRVLSCSVLWFEDRPPARYPEMAMVSASTHDLPTIAGLWTGSDLAGQQQAGLNPSIEGAMRMRNRLAAATQVADDAPVEQVIERTYALLAGAPSKIVTAMLDDALAVEQRINMPGTVDQWPNWSTALPGGIEALEASPLAQAIAGTLSSRRGKDAGAE